MYVIITCVWLIPSFDKQLSHHQLQYRQEIPEYGFLWYKKTIVCMCVCVGLICCVKHVTPLPVRQRAQ